MLQVLGNYTNESLWFFIPLQNNVTKLISGICLLLISEITVTGMNRSKYVYK